ncbi:hypothetical protein QJS10_CPA08g01461 [Acorus calamus]|uniref:Uncharacterized protein n=1 Tax=Acorus calamus TaxID=4465 RepID=A0AAV9E9S6_ACOCL|nr:hypothetical protein QJS10_CPA08g01461 [Acorus calamus]
MDPSSGGVSQSMHTPWIQAQVAHIFMTKSSKSMWTENDEGRRRTEDVTGGRRSVLEQENDHIPSSFESYMMEHCLSEEETRLKINELIEIEWRRLNEEIDNPSQPVPLALYMPALNLACVIIEIFKTHDGFNYPEGYIEGYCLHVGGGSCAHWSWYCWFHLLMFNYYVHCCNPFMSELQHVSCSVIINKEGSTNIK